MDRRTFVQTTGALGAVSLAGCLLVGDDGSDDRPRAEEPDEYPDGVEDGEVTRIDDSGYEIYTTSGQDVPLAPTGDAYEWYQNEEVVVADARSRDAYEDIHIEGAVWSPAPDGQSADDPLAPLASEQPILTYCACPHHLSGARAASLLADGYEQVFALDKGINDWIDKGYPIAGDRVE